MKGPSKVIAVFGAILAAAAFVPAASAQCGHAQLPHKSPTSFHDGIPSSIGARLVNAAISNDDQWRGHQEPDSIVGFWHAVFTANGNGAAGPPDGALIDNSVVTWHSDKTETMVSSRPPQDGNVCMGAWEQTGPRHFKLNHIGWAGYDTTNAPAGIGNPSGPTRIQEDVTVSADGKRYSGSFILDSYDLSGNLLAHFIGTIKATRITVNTPVSDLL